MIDTPALRQRQIGSDPGKPAHKTRKPEPDNCALFSSQDRQASQWQEKHATAARAGDAAKTDQ
jgi:hypothetical protein